LTLDLGKENPDFSLQHKSLEDFEKLYARVGPQNYDWYQRRFIDLGFSLYPSLKTKLIRDVFENYSPSGKNSDPVDLFKSFSPKIMDDWLKGMK
jgi:hypothetical protein